MQAISPRRAVSAALMAAAAATTLGHAGAAAAATGSVASLDWSSFSAAPADGSFAFVSDAFLGTSVQAFGGGLPGYQFTPDWSSTLASTDGAVSASATASLLQAVIGSAPGGTSPSFLADVTRGADFTIGAFSQVTFSIQASATTGLSAAPGNTASATLYVIGGDSGYALSAFDLVGSGLPQSKSGLLSVTFVNSSASAVSGYVAAEANLAAAPVPEAPTRTLMVAGLIVGGFMAARRRA